MRGPQIAAFADKHGLQAHFGRRPDRLSAGAREAGRAGRDFHRRERDRRAHRLCLSTPFDSVHHFAFVYGKIGDGAQRADAPASRRCGARRVRRRDADPRRARHASRRPGAACSSICATARRACRRRRPAQAGRLATPSAATQWREVGLGAQILRDLGISSIQLLSTTGRAPMSGSPGSASRSRAPRPSRRGGLPVLHAQPIRMPALEAGIHANIPGVEFAWMAGSGPAMTTKL